MATAETHRPVDARERIAELRDRITRDVGLGRLEVALERCDEAIDLAHTADLGDEADLVFCIRSGIQIARGEGEGVVAPLRRILMASTSRLNRFQAAYTVSQFHDAEKDSEKSLFYAKQALRYAEELDDPSVLGRAFNRLGNLLTLDSYFDEAAEHYRRALDLQSSEDGVERAIMLSNLGYCSTVLGHLREGLDQLIASLRMLRRLHADRWSHLPHLGLSYACLELGRVRSARRHAREALRRAERNQAYDPHAKNALYLLGEAEKQLGDDVAAYERFAELQRRFYAEQPFVVDVLMATDIRKMINLMA
ncbi:MAG: hypothetical protein AAGC60_19170 [Acidobacteriota bacterium]